MVIVKNISELLPDEPIPAPLDEEIVFNNAVREYILFSALVIILVAMSHTLLNRYRRREAVLPANTGTIVAIKTGTSAAGGGGGGGGVRRRAGLRGSPTATAPADDEATVDTIAMWVCTFSLSISLCAVLLLPLSILSNEVLAIYRDSGYVRWINRSLIQGLWNLVFLFSNFSLFVALPFAYLFTEAEGFPGSKKGVRARMLETVVVLVLLVVLVLGVAFLLALLLGYYEHHTIRGTLDVWSSFYLPFLYSLISCLGVLFLLLCTPVGLGRLFSTLKGLIRGGNNRGLGDLQAAPLPPGVRLSPGSGSSSPGAGGGGGDLASSTGGFLYSTVVEDLFTATMEEQALARLLRGLQPADQQHSTNAVRRRRHQPVSTHDTTHPGGSAAAAAATTTSTSSSSGGASSSSSSGSSTSGAETGSGSRRVSRLRRFLSHEALSWRNVWGADSKTNAKDNKSDVNDSKSSGKDTKSNDSDFKTNGTDSKSNVKDTVSSDECSKGYIMDSKGYAKDTNEGSVNGVKGYRDTGHSALKAEGCVGVGVYSAKDSTRCGPIPAVSQVDRPASSSPKRRSLRRPVSLAVLPQDSSQAPLSLDSSTTDGSSGGCGEQNSVSSSLPARYCGGEFVASPATSVLEVTSCDDASCDDALTASSNVRYCGDGGGANCGEETSPLHNNNSSSTGVGLTCSQALDCGGDGNGINATPIAAPPTAENNNTNNSNNNNNSDDDVVINSVFTRPNNLEKINNELNSINKHSNNSNSCNNNNNNSCNSNNTSPTERSCSSEGSCDVRSLEYVPVNSNSCQLLSRESDSREHVSVASSLQLSNNNNNNNNSSKNSNNNNNKNSNNDSRSINNNSSSNNRLTLTAIAASTNNVPNRMENVHKVSNMKVDENNVPDGGKRGTNIRNRNVNNLNVDDRSKNNPKVSFKTKIIHNNILPNKPQNIADLRQSPHNNVPVNDIPNKPQNIPHMRQVSHSNVPPELCPRSSPLSVDPPKAPTWGRKSLPSTLSPLKSLDCREVDQKELLRRWRGVYATKKHLEEVSQQGLVRRCLVYPVGVLVLVVVTAVVVVLVVVNTLQLMAGIKALPLVTAVTSGSVTTTTTMLGRRAVLVWVLGPLGALVEVLLVLYLMAASLVGCYSLPLMKKLRPVYRDTPLVHLILNCSVLLVLASALPLLATTLGITNFDLLGDYGRVGWLGNFWIVLAYNVLFVSAAGWCLMEQFSGPVWGEIYARLCVLGRALLRKYNNNNNSADDSYSQPQESGSSSGRNKSLLSLFARGVLKRGLMTSAAMRGPQDKTE